MAWPRELHVVSRRPAVGLSGTTRAMAQQPLEHHLHRVRQVQQHHPAVRHREQLPGEGRAPEGPAVRRSGCGGVVGEHVAGEVLDQRALR